MSNLEPFIWLALYHDCHQIIKISEKNNIFFLVFLRYLNNLMIFGIVRSKFNTEQFLFCEFCIKTHLLKALQSIKDFLRQKFELF